MGRNHAAAGGSVASRNDDWATPLAFFKVLDSIFNFEVDVAASKENSKCPLFISKEKNALISSSWGQSAFCNPPYSLKEEFLLKGYKESLKGTLVVNLLPASTDAQWFHTWARKAEVWLLKQRVQYEPPEGIQKRSNTKGSALIIFRPHLTLPSVSLVDLNAVKLALKGQEQLYI